MGFALNLWEFKARPRLPLRRVWWEAHIVDQFIWDAKNYSYFVCPTEFDRLLQKHATETGLPVVVDFYSDRYVQRHCRRCDCC